MACALASLFGRKCFRTGFSALPPTLLAAFSAHLAHDFGDLLGVHSFILNGSYAHLPISGLTRISRILYCA
jgi:hypothetical protein